MRLKVYFSTLISKIYKNERRTPKNSGMLNISKVAIYIHSVALSIFQQAFMMKQIENNITLKHRTVG